MMVRFLVGHGDCGTWKSRDKSTGESREKRREKRGNPLLVDIM
jgi:hypothetical protein